ncbi:MAG: CBS domain-containing protein [Acidobacteriota bacterium]|nr:CBS domain-containing protein [Blastocatellia bacterium]MDW8238604.1 CBS domain-containing protein [Acidobacteriota bacterium]
MPISDYCLTEVVTIQPDETIAAAAALMRDQHVGCLVVVEGNRPVGILTDRDIVRGVLAEGLDATQTLVNDAMTHEVVTVQRQAGVFDAISLMCDEGVRRLPVVDEEGHLVGIIALDDLLLLLGTELVNLASISATERNREREKERTASA